MMLSRRPTLKTLDFADALDNVHDPMHVFYLIEHELQRMAQHARFDDVGFATHAPHDTPHSACVRHRLQIFTETSTWPRVSRTKNAAPVEIGRVRRKANAAS